MALAQNFDTRVSAMHLGSELHVPQKQKSNQSPPENLNECFDCNICLDSCHDPVVTLCGHLYCWPCIYRWLQVQTTSFESGDQPKCPVCKACISTSSLVPLYGRGRSSFESETQKPQLDLTVPHRPPALGINTLLTAAASFPPSYNQQISPLENPEFRSFTPPAFGNLTTTSTFSPTINMVSEMVFAGMFGSSDTNLFAYPYENSYPFLGDRSPRLRRHEMQLDKSLNRVSIFLFCCIALCLVLF